jgi:heat shock protein HtpX
MAIDWGFAIRKFIVYGTIALLYVFAGWLLVTMFGMNVYLVLLLSGGFLLIQYFFSDKLVLWTTGARIVSEAEAPRLHMMVGDLARRMNLPMPKIAIVQNDMPNAFATGRNYNHSVVAVTTGIMNRLSDAELQAVLAHEMTHVKNRDMLVVVFASFLVSLLSIIIYFVVNMAMRSEDRNNFAAFMVAQLVSFIFSMTIGVVIVNTVSRYREYGADRGSALVTGKPDNLISALQKISVTKVSSESKQGLDSAKALCISPLGGGFMELFMTHPTMEHRIAALEKIKSEMRGY